MTSTHFALITSVLLGLHASAAQAQAGAACLPQSTQAAHRNACAVQRFQQADSAQNILYADVMRALSAHERPALRKEQTAWSRQRAQTCQQRHAATEHREDWPQLLHECLSDVTQLRRVALMHWLHTGHPPPP